MMRSRRLSLVVGYQYVNLVSSCIGMLHSCSLFRSLLLYCRARHKLGVRPLTKER
jgi:hypothetical protein